MEKLDARVTCLEAFIKEAELDKLQDNYERLEADISTVSSDVKNGFYRVKHQIRRLEDQGATIVKVLEYRELIPLGE